jgi:hypothetical protein
MKIPEDYIDSGHFSLHFVVVALQDSLRWRVVLFGRNEAWSDANRTSVHSTVMPEGVL